MAGIQLGFLKYTLGFDSLLFKKGISEADAELGKLQKRFAAAGAKIAGVGKHMSLGLTLPLTAFGVGAFKAAKDAAELQSAFNNTFGKNADVMNKWAEQTGNALGRSTQTMQKAANTFGLFFNNAAAPDKAAELSRQFAVLAQDLASFHNLKPEEAIEKLRAGLAGETEPLRALGIVINDATVKAKAMEMGLMGVGNELTEQEKILVRYALIMEKSKNVQGDVTKTSDSAAGKLMKLTEAWSELQVTIGTKLLPMLTPLISLLGGALTALTQLPEPVQQVALGLVAIAAATGPVLVVVGNLVKLFAGVKALTLFAGGLTGIGVASGTAATGATAAGLAFRAMLGPIGLVITAVGTLYAAWKNWDKIKAIVQNMVSAVASALRGLVAGPLENAKKRIAEVTDAFKWMYDKVVGHSYVPEMVEGIAATMRRLDSALVDPATAATAKTTAAFRKMADELRPLLDRLFPEAAEANQLAANLKTLNVGYKAGELSEQEWIEAQSRLTGAMAVTLEAEVLPALETVEAGYGEVAAAADRALSPFEQWAQSIPQSAAQIRDAFQGIAVQGLDGMADAIADVIEGTSSLKEAFGNLAKSVISDLIRMTIRMLLFRAIAGIFGGGVTPGGPASVNVGGGTDAFFSGNPFGGFRASGGPVVPGRTYVVGENGPEFLNVGRRGFVTPPGNAKSAGRIIVNQTIAPQFAGNAATREDLMRMAAITKAATIAAIDDRKRRRGQ